MVLSVNQWKNNLASRFPFKRRKRERVMPAVRQPDADTPDTDTPDAELSDAETVIHSSGTDTESDFRLRF